MKTLQELLDDVYDIQFIDNTWKEAAQACDEVRDLIKETWVSATEQALKEGEA